MNYKKLDKTDIEILNLLQEKGRITNQELAERINLSPGPTHARLKSLEEAGIIESYHGKIKLSYFGYRSEYSVRATLRAGNQALEEFVENIKEIPEVVEAIQIDMDNDVEMPKVWLRILLRDRTRVGGWLEENLLGLDEVLDVQFEKLAKKLKPNIGLQLSYNGIKRYNKEALIL